MAQENKATDYFKQTIRTYLEQRAETDELFAERYADPKKNIDDCTTYILNQVQASGCHGFADEEIYAMALHYYDEPDIEVGSFSTTICGISTARWRCAVRTMPKPTI